MENFDILIKLRKILRTVNLESKRIQKSHGVSIPQLLTLQFLKEQTDYWSTATKIKAHINLNASTVSGILSRLEQKGLIVRTTSKEDKRSAQVILSAKGLAFLDSAPTTIQERLTANLEKLSATKRAELEENLNLLIEVMDIQDVDSSPLIISGEISEDSI